MRRVDVHAEAAEGRITALVAPPTPLTLFWSRICARPATVFLLLSLVFGSLIVFATPPLRGPDEIAHFLRIYSYARGGVLPPAQVDGRKGMFIEHELNSQLQFFRSAGEWFAGARDDGVRYGQIMSVYPDAIGANGAADHPAVFAPFAGTEGYNPVAYIPYIAAGVIGGLFQLNFPDMLLFMRLLGLATFTAVAAYAIAVTPVLKWAFVLIALMPVSLYNRSVLSADGAALSAAMAITALCLKAAWQPAAGRVWERSLWMTLCALSKQPQIAFIFLECIVFRLRDLPRRWASVAAVILPPIILSPLWVWAVSAEIAVWRLQEGEHHPPEHFDPVWKLVYMWEHPLQFPLATWQAITVWGDRLWQELIGIVGWQDVMLEPWVYVLLTIFLLLVPLQKLQLSTADRARVTLISGLVAVGYVTLVYLIFYLIYTPLDVDHVRGVQGRYFVIALPVAAIFIAGLINRQLPRGMPAAIAIAGSLISGTATAGALFHAHW
jgi:Predicted membrane protein (DUF2142)